MQETTLGQACRALTSDRRSHRSRQYAACSVHTRAHFLRSRAPGWRRARAQEAQEYSCPLWFIAPWADPTAMRLGGETRILEQNTDWTGLERHACLLHLVSSRKHVLVAKRDSRVSASQKHYLDRAGSGFGPCTRSELLVCIE